MDKERNDTLSPRSKIACAALMISFVWSIMGGCGGPESPLDMDPTNPSGTQNQSQTNNAASGTHGGSGSIATGNSATTTILSSNTDLNSDGSGVSAIYSILSNRQLLELGMTETETTLDLWTDNPEPLEFTVESDAAWLWGEAASGTLNNSAQTIIVRIDRSMLTGVQASGSLRLSAEGVRPLLISVRAGAKAPVEPPIGPPVLSVSTSVLAFGSGVARLSFAVQNAGEQTLNYVISSDAAWLSLSQTSGSSAGEPDIIWVTVNREGIAPGEHAGHLQITGADTSAGITVSMLVSPETGEGDANLYVSRTLLDFGAAATRLGFVVRNDGEGVLDYTIDSSVAWAVSSSAGGSNVGTDDVVEISASRDGLEEGEYSGSVVVDATNGQQFAIALKLVVPVVGEPILELSADALDFGESSTALSFSVRNAGVGSLNWSVSSDSNWLLVDPTNGDSAGEFDTINVTADRTSLTPGEYHGLLTVSADNGISQQVEVQLRQIDPYDMTNLPYFQYLISSEELPSLNETTRPVLMRPIVTNFWFNPTYIPAKMAWYRSEVPGALLGRYFAPYNATPIPEAGNLPNKMSNIPDEWLLRTPGGSYFTLSYSNGEHRRNLDLTKPEVRAAVVDFWLANSQGWDFLLVDHFIYKYLHVFDGCAPGPAAWNAGMLALIQEWHARGNKPAMINGILRPEDTWAELAPYVGGYFYESSMSFIYMAYNVDRLYFMRGELAAYREAMDAGKMVFLTNNRSWAGVSNDTELSQPAVMGPILSATVCLVRNPGDQIYYNTNILRGNDHDPHDYHDWWRKLGTPLAPYYFNGMVVKREFANGSVSFDITTAQPVVTVTINQ